MSEIRPGQWRLARLEVLNWGTFGGHHTVDIARRGFLLTGHSGSGKSSLVDAAAAVQTPRGKLRFNAAAQDTSTRGEDRSLVTYVRGAWRRSADEDTGEVASDYLRKDATFSGVLLKYSDGREGAGGKTASKPVLLVKLYHLKRGANTPADVSELSLMLNEDTVLTAFVPYLTKGIDKRKISAAWPDAFVTDNHTRFAERFSRALGIRGDNALMLLHRTQSAKSLGTLDDLFRMFMLDRPRTFDLAETAVEQFAELSEAHRSVVEAREQVEALGRLRGPATRFEGGSARADAADQLFGALSPFTDAWKLDLARKAHAEAASAVERAEHKAKTAAAATAERASEHQSALAHVEHRGGAALAQQRALIDIAAERERIVRGARAALEQRLATASVACPTSFDEFAELRGAAERERTESDAAEAAGKDARLALFDGLSAAKRKVAEIEAEVASLRRRRSNIDDRLVRARELVADATGLPPAAFPFAAELLQVRPEHAEWTGAIERVLRPLATVMLVPEAHIAKVRAAVDARHLGTRLVFEAVQPRPEPARSPRSERSLVHCVEVKHGPMENWLLSVLTRQYDYECVDSPAELAAPDAAVTRAGQVKRSRTRHEKDDSAAVDDRSRWILGFDNHDKIEHLLALRGPAVSAVAEAKKTLDAAEDRRDARRRRVDALEALASVEWDNIDVDAAARLTGERQDTLDELLGASHDLRVAEAAAREALDRFEAAKDAERRANDEASDQRARRSQIADEIRKLEDRADQEHPVPGDLAAELERRFLSHRRSITFDTVSDVALAVSRALATEGKESREGAESARREFEKSAGDVCRRWPALTAELRPDVADRGGFLAVLERLQVDRLPDFENRFFELLQTQSQQNVAQLSQQIRGAIREVHERIDPVNRSLRRSEFDAGKYLKIRVREARGELAKQFLADLQTISTGSWGLEDRADAEQRFNVMRALMSKLGSSESADVNWRSHVLDTRLHVRFIAAEVDAQNRELAVHDTGAGLSGGQRQKLVTFCLAAALRYQLAGDDEDIPSYGTVIMDEAFDKADSNFTRMAMDVFHEFGFHMVLATPLKLLQTLEDYIGGIAAVRCIDSRDSRVGLVTIEELADEDAAGAGPHPTAASTETAGHLF
ncbi:ATP-binding protein [Sinomonas mesophila]|uniref:ATP-binding protein n=1 Tax=Sinomonas mesophila TaxID=1531955 RepID=UPI000986C11B|nr:SbcC/MukB-like Walker B domain-containing protein [Sinomonas mesophila]